VSYGGSTLIQFQIWNDNSQPGINVKHRISIMLYHIVYISLYFVVSNYVVSVPICILNVIM